MPDEENLARGCVKKLSPPDGPVSGRTPLEGAQRFYTTHYYGRTIDEFISTLTAYGVRTLVDTRSNPKSRFAEYDAQNLRARLEQHSIKYITAPQLGCPARLRVRAWRTGEYSPLWEWYTQNVLEKVFWDFMEKLREEPKPAAFMCVEKDPEKCHRHLIARALEQAGYTASEI